MVKVKICGITNLEDALLASYLGADALGFIFSPKSPRCLSPQAAEKIIAGLDPLVIKAGVFLDQDQSQVLAIASRLKLDVLQFHGNETAAYCNFFAKKFKIIKVFFPQDRPYQKKIRGYKADAFMFDVRHEQKAKGANRLSGSDLDEVAALIKSGKRVIISGGLNPANVDQMKKLKPYCLDAASGLEKMVGKKDEQLVKAFIKKVKL